MKSLVSSAFLYTSASAVAQAITLVCNIMLMRHLSITSFGEFGLAVEGIILVMMFGENGFRNFYIKKIREGQSSLAEQAGFNMVACTAVCAFFFILGSVFLKVSHDAILIISLGMWFYLLSIPMQSKFIAVGHRAPILLKDLVISFFRLIGLAVVIIFLEENNVNLILTLWVLPASIIGLFFFLQGVNISYPVFTLDKRTVRWLIQWFQAATPFVMLAALNGVYNRTGIFAAQFNLDFSELAIYMGAIKFVFPFLFVQGALIIAIMPEIVKSSSFNFDKYKFIYFFLPSLAIYICLYYLPSIFFPILGISAYLQSAELIKILALYMILVFCYGGFSNYLMVHGGEKTVLYVNVVSLVSYAMMGYWVSRYFAGLGLVVAFILIEISIYVFYLLEIRKYGASCTFYYAFVPVLVIVWGMIELLNMN